MTSSLVGSEMCIRDRAGPPFGVGYPTGQAPPPEWQTHPLPFCSGSAPVSYTHLTLPTICSV
eukprot:1690899-Prorocentrum_lima.AAC.1